jgi:hypothetical protein
MLHACELVKSIFLFLLIVLPFDVNSMAVSVSRSRTVSNQLGGKNMTYGFISSTVVFDHITLAVVKLSPLVPNSPVMATVDVRHLCWHVSVGGAGGSYVVADTITKIVRIRLPKFRCGSSYQNIGANPTTKNIGADPAAKKYRCGSDYQKRRRGSGNQKSREAPPRGVFFIVWE